MQLPNSFNIKVLSCYILDPFILFIVSKNPWDLAYLIEAGTGIDHPDRPVKHERRKRRERQHDAPHKEDIVFEHEGRIAPARYDAHKAGGLVAGANHRNGENGDEEMNAVRERAGMGYRPATLDNILEERKLELMWEGWRRQDLVRFRQFTRAYTDRPMLENEESGYTTVFPIPGDVVMQNPNITQNYGY